MEIYTVGGYVRDTLLGIVPKDRDYVVVGTTPQKMLDKGFSEVGAEFPVFLHPKTRDEYALARKEYKEGHGYKGFKCSFGPEITLEEDLVRRDLTINAMAMVEDGTIIDYFNGQEDLKNKILRHTSPAFSEDPLRVLRVARFAARYPEFKVADETLKLMKNLVSSGELDHLTPERIWKEIESALSTENPTKFFQVLESCGALFVIFGVNNLSEIIMHTHEDVDKTRKNIMDISCKLSDDPVIRWAFFTYWSHTYKNATLPARKFAKKLKIPNNFKQVSIAVIENHYEFEKIFNCDNAFRLVKVMAKLGCFRQGEIWKQTLKSISILFHIYEDKDPDEFFNQLEQVRLACLKVSGQDYIDQGITFGKTIGKLIFKERVRRTKNIMNWE